MGVFDFVKNGVREMMIARPDQLRGLLVYKHPDQNIPMYSQLTVDAAECAVFFKDGVPQGVLPPGRHTMSTQNIPFLNNLINSFTGGNVFIAEVFFVLTVPVPVRFGGNFMHTDPSLGVPVQARYHGDMMVVVSDPGKFVVGYMREASGAQDNDTILRWVTGAFSPTVAQTISRYCVENKLTFLDVGGYLQDLGQQFVQHQSEGLDKFGIRITQVGQFDFNFSDGERAKLEEANKARAAVIGGQWALQAAELEAKKQQFAIDQDINRQARMAQVAGNYTNYAAGQAMIGAGKGMAEHGLGGGIAGSAAQMAVGVGMGNAMMGSMGGGGGAGAQAQPAAGFVVCQKCSAKQPGGKFCAECGGPLAAQKKFCTGCGQELGGNAKFCANCGTAAGAQPPA